MEREVRDLKARGVGDGQGCGSGSRKSPWRRQGTQRRIAYRVLSAASGNGAACGNAEISGGNKKQIQSVRLSSHSHQQTQCFHAGKWVLPEQPPHRATRVFSRPSPLRPTCAFHNMEHGSSLHSSWFVLEGDPRWARRLRLLS